MTDSLGRSWQLGTVQLDYNMPERFGLTYTGADNAEHQPVMIHRALMGSYERFIGILLEHLGGELPVWLAPVQAIVLPIADRHIEYGGRRRPARSRGVGSGPSSTSATESVVAQDPRRRAAQDPLHAGGRATASRRRRRSRPRAPPRGRWVRWRWTQFVERPAKTRFETRSMRVARAAILDRVDPSASSHTARRRLTSRRHRS